MVADVLCTAEDFRRDAVVLSVPTAFARMGYEEATRIRNTAEESMRKLRGRLISARLLIRDAALRQAIAEVATGFDEVAAVVHESVNSFWEKRSPGPVLDERIDRFERFGQLLAGLESVAFDSLRPTVFRTSPA